ncbi:MAG: RecQ family ATP-dependent DNA helicase [Paludibacteraceae bacterium]
MNRAEAEIKLKNIFGLEHFYDEQWNAIERILRGERILMIERTGFGKSLCYQFPATQFDGVTVIFSPLIALMRNQVKALYRRGISAAYINSEQSYEENKEVIRRTLNNEIKILYVAPERQDNGEWIEATRQLKLSMVVIDEAHTISTWGHDFRPSFCRIINLVQLLPKGLPILATTATATKRVQNDIEQQMGGQLITIRGNLARPNLALQVIKVQSEEEKMIWLAQHLNQIEGTGLIYTGTRNGTEIYAQWLKYIGINAIDYNAGLDAETRKSIENGLMQNKWKCIVSTNALGMGIDKPDIRFIIHTQIPVSPIHYYQEIGRAGRDGKPTRILLFYNENKDCATGVATDSLLPLSFIDGARPTLSKYNKVINLLKEEPLSEREVMKNVNITQTQARVIKADLIDQGIIKEVLYGRTKKYEYQYNAPDLNTTYFEQQREAKLRDFHAMEQYIYTDVPRMKYLCSFLDSDEQNDYANCDNTNLEKIHLTTSEELINKIDEFRDTYLPVLNLASWTTRKGGFRICISAPHRILLEKTIKNENDEVVKQSVVEYQDAINISDYSPQEIDIITRHLENASHLVNGYAASYYGVSNVGAAIHRSKYENGGDFPDFLLKKTLSVFGKKFKGVQFDLVLYIPPTCSGNLVRNFATKFAGAINVPISHDLMKVRMTQEQKMFQNTYSKQENVVGAFDIDTDVVKGKTILLLDDIYDSGATLKEVGKLLTQKGAEYIVPIVIAKTIGGTL